MLFAQDIALAQVTRIVTIKSAVPSMFNIPLLRYFRLHIECPRFSHVFSNHLRRATRLVLEQSKVRVKACFATVNGTCLTSLLCAIATIIPPDATCNREIVNAGSTVTKTNQEPAPYVHFARAITST